MIKPVLRPELYQHWNRASKGERMPVVADEPQCGFYQRRKQRNGAWFPIAIWMQQEVDEGGAPIDDEYLVATYDGQEVDPIDIWTWCKPITEAAFNHLTNPEAETPIETQLEAGVDLTEAKPLF